MTSIDLKDIHIGSLIYQRVTECNMKKSCICSFLNRSEEEVDEIYQSTSVDLEVLLKCSKLLRYDFFRLYSHHLVLYASLACTDYNKKDDKVTQSSPPAFRKNVYTKEIIKFILELIESGEKTKQQIIDEYRIPKTTLYKWIIKYKN
ncbi:transposase [Chryseobacterium sp. SIMBA_029]|uniref:transposase n=1 Tax=Chryseobacterium sp. SIMBA_029 TaxID=3085772 RepID=UPI00397CA26E